MSRTRKVAIGVVFRRFPEGIKFLALRRKNNWKGWEFPKGGVESRETHRQAALREIREETGLRKLRLVRQIRGKIIYNYPKVYSAEHGYANTAQTAFLVESPSGKVRIERHSFDKFAWLDAKTALLRLKWDNQRNLLRRILKGRLA